MLIVDDYDIYNIRTLSENINLFVGALETGRKASL
jgi:hypothetical protein